MSWKESCLFCGREVSGSLPKKCWICDREQPRECYYFGCKDSSKGHFLYDSSFKQHCDMFWETVIPWTNVDSYLCPIGEHKHKEGHARLHWKNYYTALAFWDNSIDTRDNSNSVFITIGKYRFIEIVTISSKVFPDIWKRFDFKIRLVEFTRDGMENAVTAPLTKND